jgi:hypothetical protein
VWDASAYGIGFDLVAQDRLAWEGFYAQSMGQIPGIQREVTTITDYTGQTKGAALERIMEIMRVGDSQVIFEPDPNRTVDYKIEIGQAYNTCLISSSADDLDAVIEEAVEEQGTPVPTVDPAVTPQTVG